MKRIETVPALIDAYKTGKISKDDILWLDNDVVFVYVDDGPPLTEDEDDVPQKCVFRMHPYDLLNELLDIVGIPYSGV